MQKRLLERTLLLAGLVWSGLLLAGTPIDETRALNEKAEIHIDNAIGSVTVVGWMEHQLDQLEASADTDALADKFNSKHEIRVTGTLGEAAEDFIIKGDKDQLTIEVVYPEELSDAEGSHLKVVVPLNTNLYIQTISADIDVHSMFGGKGIKLTSVSGDIDIAEGHLTELTVKSVSGDINASGAEEAILETVSGDIYSKFNMERSSRHDINTVSGDVTFLGSRNVQSLSIKSVSGDITADFGPTGDGHVAIKTLSGELELALPENVSAQVHATTFSGEIESDFDEGASGGTRTDFSLGTGSADITIESFSGEIEILKR